MSEKSWIKRLWALARRASSSVSVIEYPTDVRFVADGETESITLTGNMFGCAWGMKGIRLAHPDFVEQWLTIEDVNECAVVLRRPSSLKHELFIPRGTKAAAQLISGDVPSSPGHMDLISPEVESRRQVEEKKL